MDHVSIFQTWYKNDSGESKHMAVFKAKQDIYTLLVRAYLTSF